ncbi:hypothetical protein H9X96_14695 [Pedobacter sp. N36a]|uniref:hypothetical protein n=1 Tax=Pedobacter sp. N36a TaxID=2767996 RepID=UPI001656E367|nr:hypothetical protein [Pedobacter sp. N36a]MBC8987019.1 hypothetical protein [Pedobacter sp. N36a]
MTITLKKYIQIFFLVVGMLSSVSVFAQEDNQQWIEASPASQAYHASRFKNTTPPYGLAKVKAMIAGIKSTGGDGDIYFNVLSSKLYQNLSLPEKFTYHMIHPEISSQNCDIPTPILEEDLKIFGNLPDPFDEQNWSERQLNFFISNRDTVLSLISESINRSKKVGLNYKIAIEHVNGWEVIPVLINVYKTDRKDHDILTVLIQLMKKNDYQPFMTSASYLKLYGNNSTYTSFISFNQANEDLVINRAEAFYNGRKK